MKGFPPPAGFRCVGSDLIRAGEGRPVRIVHPDAGLRITLEPIVAMPGDWYQFDLTFPPEGLVEVLVQFLFVDERVLWLRLPTLDRNRFHGHFRLESGLKALTLVVTGSGRLDAPTQCRFERVGLRRQLAAAARRGVDIFRRDGFGVIYSGFDYLWRLTRPGSIAVSRGSAAVGNETPYETWIRIFDENPERDRARHEERLAGLVARPLISVLTVLTAADGPTLAQLARSVTGQIYPQWELVLAAPAALHRDIQSALAPGGLDAARLRIVNAGASVAESLNTALAASQGSYVLPLSESSLPRPHALLELALTLELKPSAALIYWDDDEIDARGARSRWRFKPAWSPDLLTSWNYLGELTLMRAEAIRALGGWRAVASPQHDLVLRLANAGGDEIVHLAKVLVHVRDGAQIVPPDVAAPLKASSSQPRVSLIIPTRDAADVLQTCIRSIKSRTRYPDYEILIIDNGSVEEKTKQLFAELSKDASIRILPRPGPFNFSTLNNSAAREATGAIIGLINNDIEVTHEDWLADMVALAVQPEVGCVGAKLVYPDGRIQHAGVVIGLGGVAGHVHRFAPCDEPGYVNRLRYVNDVSAVTAACLIIRKEVFDAVNGLDEELTVAFNDVDFCLRVRAAGYLNLWTPFAELIHHESVSRGRDLTPTKARRFASEYAMMQRRWGAALLSDPYYSPHLTYDREDSSLRLR
jgi:GT2 family glycosyltransferase